MLSNQINYNIADSKKHPTGDYLELKNESDVQRYVEIEYDS